jgi:hypothetical protein
MDPLTLLAIAKASYEAVKAGVAVGKEIQGVAKDLGSLFDSVAHITRIAAEPTKGTLLSGKSAEQLAMEAYAAKAEADAMMADLKNHFIGEHGIAAWDSIIAATTRIKKEQRAAALAAAKQQEEALESLQLWLVFSLVTLALIALITIVTLALLR